MSMNIVKRAAITAGLVGAVACAAVMPAQAAPSQEVRSPQAAVTTNNAPWYSGSIVAFKDNFLEMKDANGTIAKFDLTKGVKWYGLMRMGAQVRVQAELVDGVYIAKAVLAVIPGHEPVTTDNDKWYQGTVSAFTDNSLEIKDANGAIQKFDLAQGPYWLGIMRMGATAYVKAELVDGVYVTKAVMAVMPK